MIKQEREVYIIRGLVAKNWMLSRWTGVKENKPENKSVMTYPDGEEEQKGKIYPSYKKLLKIREARRAAAQR